MRPLGINYSNIGLQPKTGGFVYLLDLYGDDVEVAYSTRLLRSDYTGDCIRVRRTSDNAEQDIGFVGNEIDTASIESFCSGTTGVVTTWYDQSASGHDLTQSVAAQQPTIIDSGGNFDRINGKVVLHFGQDWVQNTTDTGTMVCVYFVGMANNSTFSGYPAFLEIPATPDRIGCIGEINNTGVHGNPSPNAVWRNRDRKSVV